MKTRINVSIAEIRASKNGYYSETDPVRLSVEKCIEALTMALLDRLDEAMGHISYLTERDKAEIIRQKLFRNVEIEFDP